MLPSTRGAEVLYYNVVRPVLGNVKARTGVSSGSTQGFSMAGTTAPSSFERELVLQYATGADFLDEKTL